MHAVDPIPERVAIAQRARRRRDDTIRDMSPRVTVVLTPSGPVSRDTIRSLDRQSLPVADFEVLIVPQGATPRDLEQIKNLSDNRPNVRLAPAGTSEPRAERLGARRNAGAAAATGTYVLFLQEGTVVGDQALERLCAYADEHGADICLGRTSRRGSRPGAATVFAANRPRAQKDATLLGALDAGKIYRRSFLETSGLRFPEAANGTDDEVDTGFDLEAVSRTEAVAVLADHFAFAAAGQPTVAAASARLAAVAASSVPEALRADALLAAHANNLDMVVVAARAGLGKHWTRELANYRSALNENVPASLDERLTPGHLAVSGLLRSGNLDEVASTIRGLSPRPRISQVSAGWVRGALELAFDVSFPAGGRDVADLPPQPELGLCVFRSAEGVEWSIAEEDMTVAHDAESGVRHVTARVRPGSLAGGDPLPSGIWTPALLVNDGGVGRRMRVPYPKGSARASYTSGRASVSFSDAGKLALDVGATSRSVVSKLDPARASISADARGTLLRVEVPDLDIADGTELPGRLRIGRLPVLATIRAEGGRPVLEAWVSGLAGSYRLATQFSAAAYAPTGLVLEIDGVGAMTARALSPSRAPASAPAGRPSPTGTASTGTAGQLRRALRRIPGAQAVYRRLRAGTRSQGK